jgi:hypothetical protein
LIQQTQQRTKLSPKAKIQLKKNKAIQQSLSIAQIIAELPKPFANTNQEFAYYHPADELFYGGKAGVGKSFLILLLAAESKSSLILRRQFPRTRALIEESRALFARGGDHSRDSFNESLHLWRLHSGTTIEFGALQFEHDKQKYQGQAHACKFWDEITEFTESQYRYVNIWNRHPDPKVRCRIMVTGNPPTTVDGEWVMDYWGAFVDPDHEDPAEEGSLVWYVRVKVGEEDQDVEIPNSRVSCAEVREYIKRGEMPPRPKYHHVLPSGEVKILEGRSRSFLAGSLEDNKIMMDKGYDKLLDALPEFERVRFREGLFQRVTESTDLQVIPTAWIVAAMDRWIAYMGTKSLDYGNALTIYRTKNQSPNMSAMGVDPSRGGDDETAIAIRFNDWIAPLHLTKGKYVEDGDAVRDIIQNLRIGNPQINIDVVGVGSSPYDSCKKMGWSVMPINGGGAAVDRNGKPITDRTGLLRFKDMNAMLAWKLMEALDPQYNPTLMLPPDPKLKAELCSIRRASIDGGVVTIESKKEIKKRLGRSPDRADAVKYALLQSLSIYAPNQRSQAMALGKVSEWG